MPLTVGVHLIKKSPSASPDGFGTSPFSPRCGRKGEAREERECDEKGRGFAPYPPNYTARGMPLSAGDETADTFPRGESRIGGNENFF